VTDTTTDAARADDADDESLAAADASAAGTAAAAAARGSTATTADKLAELRRRLDEAEHAGSARAVEKQHAKGKRTARERIALLLDEGSFTETDRLAVHRASGFGLEGKRIPGDGVVTGYGTVDGRRVCVFSQDFTVFGGSLGEVFAEKIVKVMDLAIRMGVPVVGINDSGGARIQEGVVSLGGYGDIFYRNVKASGVIPQISAIMGPCAGGAVYSPAMTDFIFMVKETSHMFITGPEVIKTVTGEDVTFEGLGGAMAHNTKSGVAHFAADDEESSIEDIKYLLSFLPSNNLEEPPRVEPLDDPERADPDLDTFMPDSSNVPYDMRDVITRVMDDGEFFEVQQHWATNIVIGFARLDGHPVGVVANQPMSLAGVLDNDSSQKAGRFVRTCDAFNIPIVTFVDVPGFMPGTSQEWGGIIRHGAKLLYAYCEATVPKLTVITRKAYGGAYDVMGSKHVGADVNLAWPTAEIAVMGAQGAVNILYRKEIAEASDPDARRVELIDHYNDALANPWKAAERGYVDDVIEPSRTRPELIKALRFTMTKRHVRPPRKHGNIPL
jgi:propionyl-CoA carboxylase beta chain